MNQARSALALQVAQLLADWRFLRRGQILRLLSGRLVPKEGDFQDWDLLSAHRKVLSRHLE